MFVNTSMQLPYTVCFDKTHSQLHISGDSDLTLITDHPTYDRDRAEYAFGFAKEMMANVPNFNPGVMNIIPAAAVKLADALIAELQKPKQ